MKAQQEQGWGARRGLGWGWGVALAGLGAGVLLAVGAMADVEVREERLVLPTYVAGDPEPNPMFYFGRASQGAEGRVYPYPLYDTLTHRREERAYRMVVLENAHVRLGILPELGGRLFEGVDKANGYPFVYRQHVIKPALIGLIGAWISGGIEWNIPHHHRATTFLPVQEAVESHPDGSRTVWVGELELRHRTRWAVGYTLYPDRSYLEAKIRILNRTPVVQTFLCFANVAVHVDEQYQVIFPPRTQWVTHHHKREFTTWPVATTRYGGYDFSGGVDVSWFQNHVAANSMFAWNDEDDFLAGYDHGRQAGLVSVADRHQVPGKKLWTWGNGPRGRMWDRILTDDDGPYIELMVGAYSDNQPDYSWLQPGEVKSFSITWYPFQGLGGVKGANREGAVNLEVTNRTARVGFCTTTVRPAARVRLEDRARGRVLLDQEVRLTPAAPFLAEVALPAETREEDLRASLAADGQELLAYTPVRRADEPMPEPVKPPGAPAEIPTQEELYLTGLRIEQFHHPNLDPEPYWEEALRRDPGDARVNTALGIRLLKAARYGEAESRLRAAIARLTAAYTAPKDAEPIYYLGVTLKAQERWDEAFAAFQRAAWSAAWRGPASFGLAEMAAGRGEWTAALEFTRRALEANALDLRALTLRAALWRHVNRPAEAREVIRQARQSSDPLDVRILAEDWLLARETGAGTALTDVLLAHPATALETAVEYGNAGLWRDGYDVLSLLVRTAPDPARVSPLVEYYLGELAERLGCADAAAVHRGRAVRMSPAYVFPFQAEMIPVLRRAMASDPTDARAPYYLGNLLFDGQPAEAVRCWERAAALDPSWAIVHRNLAIAYAHRKAGGALERAIASLERAVALPDPYPLHFYELDQLYAAAGVDPGRRLAVLEAHADCVAARDDAWSRYLSLLVFHDRWDEAIRGLQGRRFAVWEGGSLSVADTWVEAHLRRGQGHWAAQRLAEALADFEAANELPDNLPSEDRGRAGRTAEVAWWIGRSHHAAGREAEAREWWARATRTAAPDAQRYYQGRAFEALGEGERARALYRELVQAGEERLAAGSAVDFFASFGEQQSQRQRQAAAHYWIGLGRLGLGEATAAREAWTRALEASPDHLGAAAALRRGFTE